jgi:hypothetical protein
MDTINS